MSIHYIKNGDGSKELVALEKTQTYYLNELKLNPWINHRALPTQSEATSMGGGRYKFILPLGADIPTRQSSTAVMDNTIKYDGILKTTEQELVVNEPFLTKFFPMKASDVIQMDGISFVPVIMDQIVQSLVAAEIQEETSKITSSTDIRVINNPTSTTPLKKLKVIKDTIASYYAINDKDATWKSATSTIKAYDYFTAQNGSLSNGEIKLHLHPKDIMDLSNAMTEAGTGSELQFVEMKEGTTTSIAGVSVISNKYIPAGEFFILPTNTVGTPAIGQMTTDIVSDYNANLRLTIASGRHFFDAVLLRPELTTKLTFVATPPAK